MVLPLDLGLRLPEDKSLSLLIEITEEMDYRELYAAYEQSFRSIITVLKRLQKRWEDSGLERVTGKECRKSELQKDLEMLEKFQERQEKYDEHNAAWH